MDGKKQGCIKKNLGTERARLAISRRSFATEVLQFLVAKRKEQSLPPAAGPILRMLEEKEAAGSTGGIVVEYR